MNEGEESALSIPAYLPVIIAGVSAVIGACWIYSVRNKNKSGEQKKKGYVSRQDRAKALIARITGGDRAAFQDGFALIDSVRVEYQNSSPQFFLQQITQFRNSDGEHLFHIAIRNDWPHETRKIIALFEDHDESLLTLLTSISAHGTNAIHLACFEGNDLILSEILLPISLRLLRSGEQFKVEKVTRLLVSPTRGNGWTPLHLAVAKGHLSILKILFQDFSNEELGLEVQDFGGHSAFMIACCNGHFEIAQFLKTHGSKVDTRNKKGRTALHFSAQNGHTEITKFLIKSNLEEGKTDEDAVDLLQTSDITQSTPLHLAAVSGRVEDVKLLLLHGAEVDATTSSGETALHSVCTGLDARMRSKIKTPEQEEIIATRYANYREILRILLENGAKILASKSNYGKTPVHEACRSGNHFALKLLLETVSRRCQAKTIKDKEKEEELEEETEEDPDEWKMEVKEETLENVITARDFDGMTPLHDAVTSFQHKAKDGEELSATDLHDVTETLKILLEYLPEGVGPDIADYSESTPLFLLSFVAKKRAAIDLAKTLLAHNANPLAEHLYGWNALHAASNSPYPYAQELFDMLEAYVKEHSPEYKFDKDRKRDFSKSNLIRSRCGKHNLIPLRIRNNVMRGDFTLNGIAEFIQRRLKQKKSVKIAVMTGAGVSVNAGIPDFRGRDGIYKSKSKASLFSARTVATEPQKFYDFVRETMLPVQTGKITPTRTHLLIRLLQEKGMLQKLFTQNIDTLDERAGIKPENIVHAHGSFDSFRCNNPDCEKQIGEDEKEALEKVWRTISDGDVPICARCNDTLRPNVVFFGEPLGFSFTDAAKQILPNVDLLIVMGTTLMVYPFAGLLSEVKLLCPRLLINREPTGPFKNLDKEINYRDVLFEGDCDEGCFQLAKLLGWEDDLLALEKNAK
eukprot:TRINITY_DN1820_c0_g1_i1.p1 TRINITY_DN1820_c0_g1~~TRINITY_DN1820_c0_g1_i1.p1  ORF type:complete len:931 (-),score=193.78 TRINITY_DN1820_c0_g1_i1:2066-4813(-)